MNASPFDSLTYDEFDTPFDSIDGVVFFILHPDNTDLLYTSLRYVIECQAAIAGQPRFSATTIGVVRGMRETRLLMDTAHESGFQIIIALRILCRAVEILRSVP